MRARFGAHACLSLIAVLAGFQSASAADNLPQNWQIDMPEAATPVMEGMRDFHTLLMVIITAITLFVLGLLLWVMYRYRESANPVPSKVSHNTIVEVLWTIVPVLILVVIAIPSFRLLYQQYSFPKADVTIKVTGKQWYWSYEYPDYKNVAFDAYPVDEKDLKPGQVPLLATDNEIVVPVNKVVHALVTSGDVTHQWIVLGFGTRVDAIPGRVNRTWFQATKIGTYYGECSQLCGQGHPYMPINVKVVSEADFNKWIQAKQQTAALEGSRTASAVLTKQASE